jgi:hypothetical protein
MSIEDLQPKDFTIKVKGLELPCKPPRLSHTLVINKVGEVFTDSKNASREQIEQAEKDFDWVIGDLIPKLKGINLDIQSVIDVITQIMEHVQPAEDKELKEKGVKFDVDPKAERIG